MNRLPGFDRTTRRSETAVFTSLALAGIVSIVFATSTVVKSMDGSGRIVAELSGNFEAVACKTLGAGAPATLTNVTTIQSRRSPTTAAAPGKV